MRSIKHILCVLLIAALLLPVFGCFLGNNGDVSPEGTDPLEQQSPAPTESDPGAKEALLALDRKLFLEYALSDGISMQLLISDRESFGIDEPVLTVGSISGEDADDAQSASNSINDYLNELHAIDKSLLSDKDAFTYDTMERYLNDLLSGESYEYFYEPLTPYTGIHNNLPLNLALLPMEAIEDVEIFLALLSDCGRLIGEIVEYEREKADRGMFMSDAAAEYVIEECGAFIQSGEDCFLIGAFEESLRGVPGIDEEERDRYVETCRETVINSLLPAYEELMSCIEELKGQGQNEGLRAFENGREYFANELRIVSCGDLEVSEAFDLLEDTVDALSLDMIVAMAGIDMEELYNFSFTLGSVEENMEYLSELMKKDYPELSEHEVSFMEIPSELSEALSPAAYLIPPVDDSYDNLILLNPKAILESDTMLSLLAHEGYPGHMYQYVYQRDLDHVGLFRSVASLTAYAEGWSQAAEEYVYENSSFDKKIGTTLFANNMITGVLLPAIISIGYNYYSWTVEDVYSYLEAFQLDMPEYVDVIMEFSVMHPFYYLEYALGYAQYVDIKADYEKAFKGNVDLIDWHRAYLDIGPGYFDLIRRELIPEK